MSFQIDVKDKKINNLSLEAQSTLKRQIEEHMETIIKEASLIEQATREDGASQEITSNIILQAVKKNKSNFMNKPRGSSLFFKVSSPLSLLVTGFLFDHEGFDGSPIKLGLFIVMLIFGSISTVMQFVAEDRK